MRRPVHPIQFSMQYDLQCNSGHKASNVGMSKCGWKIFQCICRIRSRRKNWSSERTLQYPLQVGSIRRRFSHSRYSASDRYIMIITTVNRKTLLCPSRVPSLAKINRYITRSCSAKFSPYILKTSPLLVGIRNYNVIAQL
jgi:hypothetical protein